MAAFGHTFASSCASGSCLSTSLEKSLSGLRTCTSDMMGSSGWEYLFGLIDPLRFKLMEE